MEEQTTTDASVDTGAQALPVETETATAAEATVEQTQEVETPDQGGATASVPDEKLSRFAQSHGLELDSPNAIKAAKMAMDNQAEFQRNRQKATELEKNMTSMVNESAEREAAATGQDPELVKTVRNLQAKSIVDDFWVENPDARQYKNEMAKIVSTSGLIGEPGAILKAAYAMAVANNLGSVKSQSGREALERVAHKQQAAVPTGSATNSSLPNAKSFSELSVKEMEAKLGFVNR